jgi:hypothetical protein
LRILRVTVVVAFGLLLGAGPPVLAQSLPASLSDTDFWAMIDGFSEPGGSFASDNIISNEIAFQQVIPELQKAPHEGAYLGVGPEQNFTYITALKPGIAFIIDIRRQNLLLHLMYKALAEISTDRADFMSRLFARPAPAGVGTDSTARALFDAFGAVPVSEGLAASNLRAILDRLKNTHGFPLTGDDERGIEETYRSLYLGGPSVRGNFGGGSWIPSYADLMAQTDGVGKTHSYLASEENFQSLKDYEQRNLIVPLVGDFAGDRTIRSVGRYLKEHDATVATFYTSNVEEYLFKGDSWGKFARNVSVLPIGGRSMFIRTYFTREDLRTLLDSMQGLLNAFMGGEVRTYNDVILRSKTPAR